MESKSGTREKEMGTSVDEWSAASPLSNELTAQRKMIAQQSHQGCDRCENGGVRRRQHDSGIKQYGAAKRCTGVEGSMEYGHVGISCNAVTGAR